MQITIRHKWRVAIAFVLFIGIWVLFAVANAQESNTPTANPAPSILGWVSAGYAAFQGIGWLLARFAPWTIAGKIGRWMAHFPGNVGLPMPPSGG